MSALLGLLQFEARPALDNFLLMLNVVEEHLLQGKHAGHTVDERQHDHAKTHLQLRVLVQLVQHDLGQRILLQVNYDVDAMTVRSVVNVGNLGQLLVAHELTELLEQALAVHLVGNLADHDRRLAVLAILNRALRTNGERAAARLIRIENALLPHDNATSGEIRAGQRGHELFCRDVGVVEHHAGGVDRLAEIVRRDVRCHANCDAVRAVDQQVREARGKNFRLLEALVVVRLEINRLLVEVAQKLHSGLIEARLGVAHCCCGVTVD